MLKLFFRSFVLRKFETEALFSALDLLQSKQLTKIDSALDQAGAEYFIIRELKRRGIKSIAKEI
jgi:hypothetical protein